MSYRDQAFGNGSKCFALWLIIMAILELLLQRVGIMDKQQWTSSFTDFCERVRPRSILEFGSGLSTTILARYGHVTAIEYDPPADWFGIGPNPNVDMKLIPWETGLVPHNLLGAFFGLILEKRALKGDILQVTDLHAPLWDLAFIDGAVHNKLGGYCHGDVSYLARMSLMSLCSAVCKYVLIDDVDCMISVPRTKIIASNERLCLISGFEE